MNSGLRIIALLVLLGVLAGCGQQGATASVAPAERPEAVLKQFYGYITEAKITGGTSPANEAFKLINSERAQLSMQQFSEIIKKYPPGFVVEVGEAHVTGQQARVDISYKMSSMFGGEYTVKGVVPLTIDGATNTWKIDFTGESMGSEDDGVAMAPQS